MIDIEVWVSRKVEEAMQRKARQERDNKPHIMHGLRKMAIGMTEEDSAMKNIGATWHVYTTGQNTVCVRVKITYSGIESKNREDLGNKITEWLSCTELLPRETEKVGVDFFPQSFAVSYVQRRS